MSLDDGNKPDYVGWSYVCGPHELAESIIFNDVPGWRIRPNLAAALRGGRREAGVITTWVDALCLYLDRHRTIYRANLSLGPPFFGGRFF